MRIACSAGGLIVRDNHVLLVKITYGENKDHWMLPGGFVEEGETIEEAAIREVKEETGLDAITKRLLGLRSGVRQVQDKLETSVHFIFEMELKSDVITIDGNEIQAVQFRPIDEILSDQLVVGLTKEAIQSYQAAPSDAGLFQVTKNLTTNNSYTKYDMYMI